MGQTTDMAMIADLRKELEREVEELRALVNAYRTGQLKESF